MELFPFPLQDFLSLFSFNFNLLSQKLINCQQKTLVFWSFISRSKQCVERKETTNCLPIRKSPLQIEFETFINGRKRHYYEILGNPLLSPVLSAQQSLLQHVTFERSASSSHHIVTSTHNSGLSEPDRTGGRGYWPPQILKDQLILLKPGHTV